MALVRSEIWPKKNQVQEVLEVPREFVKDGFLFLRRCQKPDQKEFIRISQAVGMGFLIMGAIGYVIRLIHIPLNQILVGSA
ncbi:hypothetical protein P8C59_009198 [Phyllachora maydis]|uniref:Uncharacterized protein n=1 Tax=Phyllachora maydis TaxID=1825666 RepID=A0AAD9ID15_9PEZI|nr:hypothetical protein P8C59_009198 [Phyllachora maydis]